MIYGSQLIMKNVSITLFLLMHVCIFSVAQRNFFVAQTGNDTNPGTIDKPLKTLTAALAKVAGARETNVNIFMRDGTYAPVKTIEITPEILKKHRLTLAAYGNEAVIITGAMKLKPRWKVYKGKIIQATIGKGLAIDRLFCNGKPLYMARYPDYDSTARVFNGTAADALSKERIRGWRNPTGGYVHALHQGEWGDFHYRILGKIGQDSLRMEGGWQNNRPAPMHREYRYVENIFEELNSPGEWFYNNQTGVLYFYPFEGLDVAKSVFERSTLDDIIRIKGTESLPAENVSIKRLTFTGTNRTFMLTREPLLRSDWTIYRGGAILTEGAQNIHIDSCHFEELGGHAIFVSKYNNNVSIAHNYIHNIGANAIAFVGDTASVRSPSFKYEHFVPVDEMNMTPGPKNNNYPRACKADDNLIHNIGTNEKQVAGFQISMSMDITISHNTIYDVPRSAINIGDGCWGGHIIEFNDAFNTVMETGDHGAFNSWGRDRFWLPGIDDVNALVQKYPELPFLDVIKPITLRNNRFQCAHGWDIDLDDGSSNYLIYNNLCLNGGLKLREGFRRIVTNNVIVNNTFHPHVWYAKSQDVFAHNIVTADYAPIRVPVWGHQVDSNFFIQPSALIHAQENKTDMNSLYGDPQFVNEMAGNFNVIETSRTKAIGFKNFPMDEFGVVSEDLKRKAKQPTITEIRTLGIEKAGATTEWMGAVIKNVETLGEQSASGLPDKDGVLIVSVKPESLADKNGLIAGDVVRKINGTAVKNVGEMLNSLQVVMWQGNAMAEVVHNQQLKEMRLRLK